MKTTFKKLNAGDVFFFQHMSREKEYFIKLVQTDDEAEEDGSAVKVGTGEVYSFGDSTTVETVGNTGECLLDAAEKVEDSVKVNTTTVVKTSAKKESFNKYATDWLGLWWHPEYQSFSSACVNVSSLNDFKGKFRVIAKKNPFYNGGQNSRPNYLFKLVGSQVDPSVDLGIYLSNYEGDEYDDCDASERKDTKALLEELKNVMYKGHLNADHMVLPSESQARAAELFNRAVEIIEEITGEKWDFSYITFY